MSNNVIVAVKIGLSILLLLCLADMPYGFYQLVRFLTLIIFGLLAIYANSNEKQTEVIVYITLAILFQPFFKISLGRTLWNIVDVFVAIGLILTIFTSNNNEKMKE